MKGTDPGTNVVGAPLLCLDRLESRSNWEWLADGGSVSVPLEKQMWGAEFGACEDRFGISWMVNIAQPQA